MSFFLENWNFVVKGLLMTLQLALVVLLFTTLVSVVFGVLATLPQRWLGWLIHGYVELFRSIPLIVNVFFIFFGKLINIIGLAYLFPTTVSGRVAKVRT